MYLHLGNEKVISGDQIIAILNLEEPTAGQNHNFVETAQRAQQLIKVGKKGKQKALVICDERVYLSPISSHTLYKRAINCQRED